MSSQSFAKLTLGLVKLAIKYFNFKPAARHLVARYKVDSVAEVKPIEVSLVETLHRREVKVVGFYTPVNDMELNVGDSNVVKGAGACWAGEMMMIFWACVHHNQLVEAPQRRLWTLGWKSLTQRLVSESLYDRGADVLLPCTTGRPCDVQCNAITFQCLCLCLCVCVCMCLCLCTFIPLCVCVHLSVWVLKVDFWSNPSCFLPSSNCAVLPYSPPNPWQ